MDAATQKLVDEAAVAAYPDNGTGVVRNGITLGERHAFKRGYLAALEAAQRPPVSPEALEELRWLCHTGGLNAEGEQDGDLLAEEILARFSVPSQPVYDEESK